MPTQKSPTPVPDAAAYLTGRWHLSRTVHDLRSGADGSFRGTALVTHMHWDHCYYLDKFTGAQFFVHEKEYAFAMNPIPLYYKSYEHPALGIKRPFEGIEMTTVSGETEIIPGVRVFETFGHSPGHQSVEVDTKNGSYICCGDSLFVLDNLNPIEEIHYNITPPGRYVDIIATWESIELQKKRAARPELILPCHEAGLLSLIKETPVLGL